MRGDDIAARLVVLAVRAVKIIDALPGASPFARVFGFVEPRQHVEGAARRN